MAAVDLVVEDSAAAVVSTEVVEDLAEVVGLAVAAGLEGADSTEGAWVAEAGSRAADFDRSLRVSIGPSHRGSIDRAAQDSIGQGVRGWSDRAVRGSIDWEVARCAVLAFRPCIPRVMVIGWDLVRVQKFNPVAGLLGATLERVAEVTSVVRLVIRPELGA